MKAPRPLHIALLGHEKSVHIRRWVAGLRALGHNVDLVTLWKDPKYDIGGIALGAKSGATLASKLSYLTIIGKLRTLVEKLRPDILHAHHASSNGFLISWVRHPRKIVSVWGDDVIIFPYRGPIQRAIIRRTLRRANHITATSECLREAVVKIGNQIPQITVIPFGIDLDHFRFIQRRPKDIVTIGITKWLHHKYGIDILIRAFEPIARARADVRLLIAGTGPKEGLYKELVRTLGIEDRVIFAGLIDHDCMPQFLSGLDIYAMPSVHHGESFGVAALEAAATGLPVVGSRIGGVPEVVIHGETGMLVEPRNVRDLQSALEKLISDPALRLKMGVKGRRLVETRYRWEDNLNSMQNLYFRMVG